MSADEGPDEVVVTLEGRPRPATVVARRGDQVEVRYRQGGGYEQRWVPASSAVAVEDGGAKRPPVGKVVGGALVALFGLVLVLWPHGSDRPLLESLPTPTPTPSAAPTPTVRPTTAVLFGDSFTAGKNTPRGTRTALEVAARELRWPYAVKAQPGTGWTTTPSYADRLAREVTSPPSVLVLQGGASDTGASAAQLRAAVTRTVTALRTRFPTTTLVLVGPVAMEQPPDAGLVRVDRTLAATAAALKVPYVDPLPWVTATNAPQYLSPQGFYPNPAGHAYLGAQLAHALQALRLQGT